MGSEFVRNSAKLLSAGVIAQAIGILIYPILTRIYAPEDFGLLNLFQSIAGVLIILSTAEYQYAILLPKEDAQVVYDLKGADGVADHVAIYAGDGQVIHASSSRGKVVWGNLDMGTILTIRRFIA